MVEFAVSSMYFHEYPLEEIFDLISETGLSGVEFWIETPSFWLEMCPVDDLSTIMADHPEFSAITVHAPVLDLNPCSINPRVAEISTDYAVWAIELGERIGARVVTVHPGRRTAKRTPSDVDYRRFNRYLDKLREASAGRDVMVAIENMEPKINSLLCTADAVRAVLDEEEWLYFTFDLAHALAGGPDEAAEYIRLCSGRMVNVHVSGIDRERRHLPIYGDRAVSRMLDGLRDAGYDGICTLELEDRNFEHDLSSEEKIILLMRELDVLQEIML